MTMVKIVQKKNKVLRSAAKKIPLKNIESVPIKKILADMKEALASQKDGVAIAAPQINKSFRIFVVVEAMFNTNSSASRLEAPADRRAGETDSEAGGSYKIFINPVIVKLSKRQVELEEGCLSIRWKYGKVKRASKTTIRAYDENGKSFTYSASGLLAQIFQHETDHLDGILFTDKATHLKDIQPEPARGTSEGGASREKGIR